MSQRSQALVLNALVALGVMALLHVFFVAVPSRLAARAGSGEPAPVAASAEVPPAGGGSVPVAEVAAEPVHGPSGVAPGILAAPEGN